MFKRTVKVLFQIYDVFAHIVGHLFILAVIIGTLYYKIFVMQLNGDLIYILIRSLWLLVGNQPVEGGKGGVRTKAAVRIIRSPLL